MLRIALPSKGRLADETRDLLADAGLALRARGDRALTAALGDYEAIFVRAQDIPEFVADGAADAGITGWDLVVESGRDVDSLLDLEFGRCRLVVAGRDDGSLTCLDQMSPRERVATVFPRVTRAFFAERGQDVDLVPVSGSVEITPHLGIANVIVDLTETGSTLRVNGMRELATVLESTARLVAARGSDAATSRPGLADLVTALESVVAARTRRYVMANVPRTRLDEIRRILPGVSGPTVIDVLNGGRIVAVHAVCSAAAVDRTIRRLRAAGGTGILVTRIERFLP